MHGEYKTPGGKLVVVDFEIKDDHLHDVRITGDFFVYPEESWEAISRSLDNVTVSTSEHGFAEYVRGAIPNGTELLGTSPEGIAIAVIRALNGQ